MTGIATAPQLVEDPQPTSQPPDEKETAPTTPALLVDAKAAADLLGISRAHLLTLRQGGRVPIAVHVGRCLRWRRQELAAWVEAGCPSAERWAIIKAAGK